MTVPCTVRECTGYSLVILLLLFGLPGDCRSAESIEADLLIVGGTESGCAAAVQAARMGAGKIVLVNDIEWLGGQFSAEALGAIDENRAHTYNGKVPIPRSGIFRDVIDAIETKNAELYGGVKRPGNTRVITTSRPVVSELIFRNLLAPFEASGQILRRSNYLVESVLKEGNNVTGVTFVSSDSKSTLTVKAKLTIDASDWGDVIQGSGAAWDAGVDSRADFGELSAPVSGDPATDFNPITYCMILEEAPHEVLFPKPAGYDPKYFTGKWGWIGEEFAYTTRRLVDGHGFKEINHPDVLLVNTPPIDYPVDVYPAKVAAALEATEPGASKKSVVAMSREQRQIVFEDAKRHTLKFYYHLQTNFPKFRKMALSNEFGTVDKMPPKPYIRESLRLGAKYIVREQDVVGFEGRSNYATKMFHDAIFSWQFEMDFHPTRRSWITDEGKSGPWEADFRGNRRFGRDGTGRCVFPLRSLVPEEVTGLLGAQKNLGYTSMVGSSCRLHDQAIHAGQACGAVAAVSLKSKIDPGSLSLSPAHLEAIWTGLVDGSSGAPLVIWPFSDVDPFDPGFSAIQHLALRRVLNLKAMDTAFHPDGKATQSWVSEILDAVKAAGYEISNVPATGSRRDVAVALWSAISNQKISNSLLKHPLPWTKDPLRNGDPEISPDTIRGFNFTSAKKSPHDLFVNDSALPFSEKSGHGFHNDLSKNIRVRKSDKNGFSNSFVVARDEQVWECKVENGSYKVTFCVGDSTHSQNGQRILIENFSKAWELDTSAGAFREIETEVKITDGRLTVTLGKAKGKSNTCLNWLMLSRACLTE